MKLFTMQPAFTLDAPFSADEMMKNVRRSIKSPELRDHVVSAGHCIDFRVDPAERRFWSPHLNVQVSDVDSGSELFCRYSPRPEVWTMFMAIYFFAAFIICCAGIYGYVQWFLGERPWALVVIPIATIVIAALHAASLVGQSLSSDQMQLLRERLDHTVQQSLSTSETQPAETTQVLNPS